MLSDYFVQRAKLWGIGGGVDPDSALHPYVLAAFSVLFGIVLLKKCLSCIVRY